MKLFEERAIIDAEIAALHVKRAYLFASRLKDCAARGLTTKQAATELGLSHAALYQASYRYGIKFLRPVGSRIERLSKVPRYAPVDIIPLATVKATAIAYRGKASASEIAAVVGTSRNAIIGH